MLRFESLLAKIKKERKKKTKERKVAKSNQIADLLGFFLATFCHMLSIAGCLTGEVTQSFRPPLYLCMYLYSLLKVNTMLTLTKKRYEEQNCKMEDD